MKNNNMTQDEMTEMMSYNMLMDAFVLTKIQPKINEKIKEEIECNEGQMMRASIQIEPMSTKSKKCNLIIQIYGHGFPFIGQKLTVSADVEDVKNVSDELIDTIYEMIKIMIDDFGD